MTSKQVTDRSKSALAVSTAGRTHAAEVATALQEILSPALEAGESIPNVALLVELLARTLDTSAHLMVKTDETHHLELSDDAAPRQARDESTVELSDELVELREWIVGLYGAKEVEKFGFTGSTPSDPVVLVRYTQNVIQAFQNISPWPKPRRAGVTWDVNATVSKLLSLSSALENHIKSVAREAREAEASLQAKHNAMAEYDERFGQVATFLVGLFRLAGKQDLADRIRPSSRRRGQIAQNDVPEGDPAATTSP